MNTELLTDIWQFSAIFPATTKLILCVDNLSLSTVYCFYKKKRIMEDNLALANNIINLKS